MQPRVHEIWTDLVPEALEGERVPERRPSVFDLDRVADAAEVRQRRRGLRVQVPVEERDKSFDHERDDARAARRADYREEPALVVKDESGRHGATRTFAGLHTVCDLRAIAVSRTEGEIGELVVEEKSRG